MSTTMCKLWTTKPSSSILVHYFALAGFEPSIDELRRALNQLGYESQASYTQDEPDLATITKGDNAILLHASTISGERYVTGIALPIFPNIAWLGRSWKVFRASAIILISYIGIVLGIVLAGLGVRGEPRPYLLEWVANNLILVIAIGIVPLAVSSYSCLQFKNSSLPERNYEAAEMVFSDLERSLGRICSDLKSETLSDSDETHTSWYEIPDVLPDSAFKALDELIEAVHGLESIEGNVVDIKQNRIQQDSLRTY